MDGTPNAISDGSPIKTLPLGLELDKHQSILENSDPLPEQKAITDTPMSSPTGNTVLEEQNNTTHDIGDDEDLFGDSQGGGKDVNDVTMNSVVDFDDFNVNDSAFDVNFDEDPFDNSGSGNENNNQKASSLATGTDKNAEEDCGVPRTDTPSPKENYSSGHVTSGSALLSIDQEPTNAENYSNEIEAETVSLSHNPSPTSELAVSPSSPSTTPVPREQMDTDTEPDRVEPLSLTVTPSPSLIPSRSPSPSPPPSPSPSPSPLPLSLSQPDTTIDAHANTDVVNASTGNTDAIDSGDMGPLTLSTSFAVPVSTPSSSKSVPHMIRSASSPESPKCIETLEQENARLQKRLEQVLEQEEANRVYNQQQIQWFERQLDMER